MKSKPEASPANATLNAFGNYLVPQQYSRYSPQAHQVWSDVLARNEWLLEKYDRWVHPAYVEGMRALDLPHLIPRVEEINERLAPTGWKTVCVEGYIPTSVYVGLMASSIFPISRAIRRPEHIDYAPAPDMVHDILGHLPLLFMPEHRDFLKRLAGVMGRARPNDLDAEFYTANHRMSELKCDPTSSLEAITQAEERVHAVYRALQDDASELTHLARMYLWSVEFGLIGNTQSFSICGAALLSSPREFRSICENPGRLRPYSLEVIHRDIAFSDLQTRYFVARDFAHLELVLEAYEISMQMPGVEARSSEIRQIHPGRSKASGGNA